MARIFTISFLHNDEVYNSMVSVKTTPYYMEYTLNSLDVDLTPLLPGNKIISTSSRTFIFPNATQHHSKELMNSIIRAVEVHLQTVSF